MAPPFFSIQRVLMQAQLIDAHQELLVGPGGELGVKTEQEIPQWFIDDCKARKDANDSTTAGEMLHVGRIPEAIALKWLREGFDVFKEPVSESLKRLRAEAAAFALTDRRI